MAVVNTVIGSVVSRSDKVASLEPLYEIDQDAKSTYRRIEDTRAEYPDRGRVVWFDPPRDARERSFWRVEVTECKTYHNKPEQNVEAFMVVQGGSSQVLSDVLDLRHIGDEDLIRQRLTVEGIELQQQISESAFLWVGPRRFVGPVRLDRAGVGQRWCLSPAALEEPLACWEADGSDILHVGSGAVRRSLAASARAWRKTGLTDWNPDDLKVLSRALHDLRRLDPDFAQTIPLTNKSIERLGSVLATAGVADRTMHEHRLRRIRGFLPHLDEDGRIGAEVLTELLDLPAVRTALAQHRETVEATVRKEMVDRVTNELAREHEELERFRSESIRAREERDAVRAEIRGESERLDELVGSFEQRLAERAAAIAADPERFLSDVTLLRAALGLQAAAGAPPRKTFPDTPSRDSAAMVLNEPQQLQATFEIAFQAAELPNSLWRELNAPFLAGTVPALIGGRSVDALRTYARCVTAGRVLRVAVSPGVLSPWELLDQVSVGDAPPQPLKDHLTEIAAGGTLALLILENINACPVDTVLVPLLRAQHEGRGPIPPNVLVAVTLSQGPARLPLSISAWEYLAFVQVSGLGGSGAPSSHPDKRQSSLPPSVVDLARWQTLRAAACEVPVALCAEVLRRLPSSLALDLGVRDHALRLFAAFVTSGLKEVSALEEALAAAVAPSLAHQADAFAAALAEQGHNFDRVRAVLHAANQIT